MLSIDVLRSQKNLPKPGNRYAAPAAHGSSDAFLLARAAIELKQQKRMLTVVVAAASEGQRAYVGMLMRILPFLDGYDRSFHVPVIAPLLSQPLVEYGLGIPVWQWSAGGHDRSLARKAFANDLPALVLQRRTKGGLESLFVPAYDRNRAHLRDFLQEGLLAAFGIIDCDAIGTATARPAGALDNDYVRILQLVDRERWARSIAEAPASGGQ